MKILRAVLELPAKIGLNWPNRQSYLAVSSKTAPRILIFELQWVLIIHFM
jgi:hypothetical protein